MLRVITKISLFLLLICVALWAFLYTRLALETHQYSQLSTSELAAAEEYLNGKLHAEPRGWSWETFTTEAGISLRTGRVNAESAKGTIVFVPGFTGTLEMSMDVIHGLHAAGFNVAGVEYRGQGRSYRPLSHPEKGYIEDYLLLADELAQFAKANKDPDLPLFFYSISKGAHITMRMAAAELAEVNAYALVVPMIKINTGDFPYQRVAFLSRLLYNLGLGEAYAPGQGQYPDSEDLAFGTATDCNGNPETAQLQSALFAIQPELRTRGTTVKWLRETVNSSEKLLNADFMAALRVPVKVFTAGDDRLVSTTAIQQFCGNLAQCEVAHFESAKHCINPENSEVRESILQQTIELFEANL